jgi:predicted nucleic acid-binding protein
VLFTARTPELKAAKDDPDDDRFIECAAALKAEAVVTGDRSLEKVGEYMGIGIINPQEFLRGNDKRT